MKKYYVKYRNLIPLFMVLTLLSSCVPVIKREYSVIVPHVERRPDDSPEGWRLAESYGDLKSILLRLIRTGESEGLIRLYRYSGDLNEDLSRVINEVMREEPLGAYAVDYIPYEPPVRFPAYYEIRLRIIYRREPEQISSIISVSDGEGFSEALVAAMSEFKDSLLVETSNYSDYAFDLPSALKNIYYNHPEFAFGMPESSVTHYPNAGFRRLLEIELKYGDQSDKNSKKRQLRWKAMQILINYSGLSEDKLLLSLFQYLRDNVQYDLGTDTEKAGNDSYNAYGALMYSKAVHEGYALALKLLCDMSGIECFVVSGLYEENEHTWNIVRLGDGYYYLDIARDILSGEPYSYFLMSDASLPAEYRFNSALYPKCESSEYSYASIAGIETHYIPQTETQEEIPDEEITETPGEDIPVQEEEVPVENEEGE